MSRLTCPKCGHSLEEEGAILSICPLCGAEAFSREERLAYSLMPLASAETASERLDVAALMQRVLSERLPEEGIDAALERVVKSEHLQNADKILQAVRQHFKLLEERLGHNPEQAAEFLAKSSAILSFNSKGDPFLEAVMFKSQGFGNLSEETRLKLFEQMREAIQEGKPIPGAILGPAKVKVLGLEQLPEEARSEVLQQIESAIEEGKPIPRQIVTRRVVTVQGSSCLTMVLAALVIGALLLVYLLSRH